jgi:AraC-like DNA-binding protein
LNRYLAGRLQGAQRSDLALEAMQLIQRSRGLLSLSTLRETLGVGERALQRAFDGSVGLSPKQAVRIMRFRHAVALLRRKPALTLSRIALLTGYADQAHFTREFRALAGVTPGYFGREQALVGFVQDSIDTDAYIRAELA